MTCCSYNMTEVDTDGPDPTTLTPLKRLGRLSLGHGLTAAAEDQYSIAPKLRDGEDSSSLCYHN